MNEYVVEYGRNFTLTIDDVDVCTLTINNDLNNKWTITAWYTKEGYMNKGYGTQLMRHTVEKMYEWYGRPRAIEYVWNGANQYVYDWLEKHFDPVCKCPLAVLKTQNDDEWDAHIYVLNTDKFLEYFGVLND